MDNTFSISYVGGRFEWRQKLTLSSPFPSTWVGKKITFVTPENYLQYEASKNPASQDDTIYIMFRVHIAYKNLNNKDVCYKHDAIYKKEDGTIEQCFKVETYLNSNANNDRIGANIILHYLDGQTKKKFVRLIRGQDQEQHEKPVGQNSVAHYTLLFSIKAWQTGIGFAKSNKLIIDTKTNKDNKQYLKAPILSLEKTSVETSNVNTSSSLSSTTVNKKKRKKTNRKQTDSASSRARKKKPKL